MSAIVSMTAEVAERRAKIHRPAACGGAPTPTGKCLRVSKFCHDLGQLIRASGALRVAYLPNFANLARPIKVSEASIDWPRSVWPGFASRAFGCLYSCDPRELCNDRNNICARAEPVVAAQSSKGGRILQRAAQAVVNADLFEAEQAYSADPLADRETDLYRGEYVMTFVEKWDELIDWAARAAGEGQFFIDVLRARGKNSVLDVATGTGFHSVRLREAGFDVTSADGSAAMLAKAFENGQRRGLILKTVQADWRWLNRDIHGKYDAIICLGNSF
ncbi:class I SAM-dependent methyltransferase, partial [Rubrimonas sp.]|uniref:class I SAM-dependent methyltransferase n=1 Tax=Rubrimonas sp. TaxID=2036015 RepID=UPI002FDD098A